MDAGAGHKQPGQNRTVIGLTFSTKPGKIEVRPGEGCPGDHLPLAGEIRLHPSHEEDTPGAPVRFKLPLEEEKLTTLRRAIADSARLAHPPRRPMTREGLDQWASDLVEALTDPLRTYIVRYTM